MTQLERDVVKAVDANHDSAFSLSVNNLEDQAVDAAFERPQSAMDYGGGYEGAGEAEGEAEADEPAELADEDTGQGKHASHDDGTDDETESKQDKSESKQDKSESKHGDDDEKESMQDKSESKHGDDDEKEGSKHEANLAAALGTISLNQTILDEQVILCKDYQLLRNHFTMMDMANEYDDCITSSAIPTATNRVKCYKDAVSQLRAAVKSLHKELTQSHAGRLKAEKDSSRARAKAKATSENFGRRNMRKANSVIEGAFAQGTAVKTFHLQTNNEDVDVHLELTDVSATTHMTSTEELDFLQPILLHGGKAEEWYKAADTPVQASLNIFHDEFKGSEIRRLSSRATRVNVNPEDDSNDVAMEFLKIAPKPRVAILACDVQVGPANKIAATEAFINAMSLFKYGSKEKSSHIQLERYEQGFVRHHIFGSKTFAMVDVRQLLGNMRRKGLTGASAQYYFRDMREQQIQQLMSSGVQAIYGTLGPNEHLVVPASYLVAGVAMSTDMLGLRYGFVMPTDKRYLEKTNADCERPSSNETSLCNIAKTILKQRGVELDVDCRS